MATGFDSSARAENTTVRAGGVLSVGTPRCSDLSRILSENSICALKLDRMDKVYGWKTLAIQPILSIQMLFSDRLLGNLRYICSDNGNASQVADNTSVRA